MLELSMFLIDFYLNPGFYYDRWVTLISHRKQCCGTILGHEKVKSFVEESWSSIYNIDLEKI